jgi:hypothetical protein
MGDNAKEERRSRQDERLSPEFEEWDKQLHNQQRRKPLTPQNARDTPELRHLEIATKILSNDTRLRSIKDGFARVLAQECGADLDTSDAERILELIASAHGPRRPVQRSGVAAPTQATPDTGRHGTIDRELQEAAKMGPKNVEREESPGVVTEPPKALHADPAVLNPVPKDTDQAPCTFSSTKSDRSVRTDTKHPKPRSNRTAIPRDIVRPFPATRKHAPVVASASSAFSHHSEGSVNSSQFDYVGMGKGKATSNTSDV